MNSIKLPEVPFSPSPSELYNSCLLTNHLAFTTKLILIYFFPSESNVDQYKLEVSPFASYKRSLLERNYNKYDQQKYLLLGKAVVYSMLELSKSKNKGSHDCVAAILDSFHPRANDIDDLMLNSENLA